MGVYGILCEPMQRWYVGASVNIHKRFYVHLYMATISPRHSRLFDDMQKHGREAFSTHILELVENQENLAEREKYWQNITGCRTHGYNYQAGGRHRSWKNG